MRGQSIPVVRLLYNHNPFYLISACFVLYAIKRVFRPMEVPYIDPWMLMAALGGLTLFMALTAWVVVRFGKVWEDARSLMLVLVMMFLAMSVSFDEILNTEGRDAFWLLWTGFGVSVGITEGVVRLLRIPMPWLFRIPFYLMLALFFGYPMLVSPEVTGLRLMDTRARVLSFPMVAGLCTLTLFPAVRRGPKLINESASPCPWKWPLLPWTLFGFLALAVCGRSYYLSISFDAASGRVTEMFTAFGVYALNPFFMAVSVILLEIAFVQKNKALQDRVLLLTAALMLVCSIPGNGGDPTYRNFLNTVVDAVGSPIFVTLFALFVFGAYAWFRGVRTGEYVVLSSLAALSVVGWRTLGVKSLTTPHPVPIGILVGVLLIAGLRKKDAFRCFLAMTAVTAGITLTLWNHEMSIFRRVVPAHFFLVATIAIGAFFKGRFSRFLHTAGALLAPVVIAITTRSFFELEGARDVSVVYFVAMCVAIYGYGMLIRSKLFRVVGLFTFALGVTVAMGLGTSRLAELFGTELVTVIVAAMCCFAMGALITAHKSRGLRANQSSGIKPV